MIRLLAVICLLLWAPPALSAAFSAADKGGSSGNILKLGAGARATGMGDAHSAVVDDAGAIYWNPAALTRIENFAVMFMHAELLADISYGFAGCGQKLRNGAALGLGVQYLTMPVFKETNASGYETGTDFTPNDVAVAVGYAQPLELFGLYNHAVGVSGKYIRSEIDKSASALAADLGWLWRPNYSRGRALGFSFVVQNLGGRLTFDKAPEPLPLKITLGSFLLIEKNWLLGLDMSFPKDNRPYVALGGEYLLAYGPSLAFAGRLGYNSLTLNDINGVTGLSMGAGVRFGRFWLDYAFLPLGEIGATHRISIRVDLEKSGRAKKAAKKPPETIKNPADAAMEREWLAKLKNPDWRERRKAAFELGKVKSVMAVVPLLELLDDSVDEVCGVAALALGRIGDRRAVLPLIERLEDISAYVRASSAKALGQLGDKRAIKPLKDGLGDDSAKVREYIREALRKLKR